MAVIEETIDATPTYGGPLGTSNYSIQPGDTLNGSFGSGDTMDGMHLTNLTIGQTYTISITIDTAAPATAVLLQNPYAGETVVQVLRFGTLTDGIGEAEIGNVTIDATEIVLDGNTISFNFTPLTTTDLSFDLIQLVDLGPYSLSLMPAEGGPAEEVDTFVGTNGKDKENGGSGVDMMSGGEGDDQLDGKAGDDALDGGAGKDKLSGGTGNDTATGGDGNDLLIGDAGDDELVGGNHNDRLHGGADNDILQGGAGNDKLYGDEGADELTGGRGKDEMSGGTGNDVFVFEQGAHRDTITDFEDGADLLDFSGHAGVTVIEDLAIYQSGAHAVIAYGGPDQVTLLNTDMLDLDASDFIF